MGRGERDQAGTLNLKLPVNSTSGQLSMSKSVQMGAVVAEPPRCSWPPSLAMSSAVLVPSLGTELLGSLTFHVGIWDLKLDGMGSGLGLEVTSEWAYPAAVEIIKTLQSSGVSHLVSPTTFRAFLPLYPFLSSLFWPVLFLCHFPLWLFLFLPFLSINEMELYIPVLIRGFLLPFTFWNNFKFKKKLWK